MQTMRIIEMVLVTFIVIVIHEKKVGARFEVVFVFWKIHADQKWFKRGIKKIVKTRFKQPLNVVTHLKSLQFPAGR